MSLNCPKCGYQVDQDFGVFTCQQCQSVLFIDLEGKVQVSEPSSENALESSSGSPTDWTSELKPEPPVNVDVASPIPPEPKIEPIQTKQPLNARPAQAQPLVPPPSPPRPPSISPRMQSFPPQVMSGGPTQSGPRVAPPVVKISVQDLVKEISEFANDTNPGQTFVYDLSIYGIDTSEIRQKVLDALSDKRFRWDARILIGQIQNGALSITKLSPVKAMVLIRRLQELPLEIRWEQKYL